MKKISGIVICAVLVLSFPHLTFAKDVYKLGILGMEGAKFIRREWQPTADYLSSKTGKRFELAPLKYKTLKPVLMKGETDFLLCEPAVFCQLREKYGLKILASRVGLYKGRLIHGLGAVILTLADSNIRTLSDLKGKRVASVKREALMGYQVQIQLLRKKGLILGKDFDVSFTGKARLVIKALKSRSADAGFIATPFFISLGEGERINFKVIEPESDDFPLPHNGPVFPDKVFSALMNTDAALADEVAAALKEMKSDSAPAEAANIYGWEEPADLSPVAEFLKSVD